MQTENTLYIKKVADKPKDAIRINSEQDIPEELKDTIHIENDEIVCLAAEGYNRSSVGSVIGYDRNAPTETGKGAWPLGPETFVEKDGVFYPAPEIRTAEEIEPPFSIETKYGTQTLEDGERGLLVTRPKGQQNILNLDTSSAEEYVVCDKDGNEIKPLLEYVKEKDRIEENIEEQRGRISNGLNDSKAYTEVMDKLAALDNEIKYDIPRAMQNSLPDYKTEIKDIKMDLVEKIIENPDVATKDFTINYIEASEKNITYDKLEFKFQRGEGGIGHESFDIRDLTKKFEGKDLQDFLTQSVDVTLHPADSRLNFYYDGTPPRKEEAGYHPSEGKPPIYEKEPTIDDLKKEADDIADRIQKTGEKIDKLSLDFESFKERFNARKAEWEEKYNSDKSFDEVLEDVEVDKEICEEQPETEMSESIKR